MLTLKTYTCKLFIEILFYPTRVLHLLFVAKMPAMADTRECL